MAEIPTPDHVRGLEQVARAWRAASRLTSDVQHFRVGICDSAGELIAAVLLDSFLQVRGFSRRLERLGYAPMQILDPEAQMMNCDVLLHPFAQVPDLLEDR